MPKGIEKEDWDRIHELACEVVNATLNEDEILSESRNETLLAALRELKEKYGKHPSILATIGDFTEEKEERMKIYSRALERAKEMNFEEEIFEITESIQDLLEESKG